MDSSVEAPSPRGRRAELRQSELVVKFFKYAVTSAVSVFISQGSLFVMASIWEWDPVVSNLVSVALGTVPSYWMSRAWVWSKSGKSSLYAEVIPFWILTFLGLGLSTLFVWIFHRSWPDNKLLVNVGNISGFGVLWVAKFFILDRLLFKVAHEHIETPTPVL
ncbi:MAG: GtrA family protein [Acidimicrobiales bacterium]